MNTLSPRHHTLLGWVVRLSGLSFVVFFAGAILLNLLQFDQLLVQSEAGRLVLHLLRWGNPAGTSGGVAYELMIATVYVVWGIFLIIASCQPLRHKLFLDFSVAANAAHFGLMLLMGVVMADEHVHLYGDVLLGWLLLAVLIAVWLPVRRFAD